MAKVIAPFKISGTLDDLNFYTTNDGNNYVRMKGKTGINKEEFKNNPVFNPIREHGKEWGYCSKKGRSFRQMAALLFQKAKDGSFAGRSIKLLWEILEEDNTNPKGSRTLEEGFKSRHIPEILLGFEGNRNRPMHQVLKQISNILRRLTRFRYKILIPKATLHGPWKRLPTCSCKWLLPTGTPQTNVLPPAIVKNSS